MKDRVAQNPNRMKITYADGSIEYVTIERADNPTQEGTPLNKGTLFSDQNAHLYGCEIPSEAFQRIAESIQVTIPASGWSTTRDSNDYVYQQVTVPQMLKELQPLASLKSPQDKNHLGYWLYVKFIETYDGYIICRAANKVPIDLVIELKGV